MVSILNLLESFAPLPPEAQICTSVKYKSGKDRMELVCSTNTTNMPQDLTYDVQFYATDLNRLDHLIHAASGVDLPYHVEDNILPKGLNVDVSSQF